MGIATSADAGPANTDKPDYASATYWLAHPIHHAERVRAVLPKEEVYFQAGVPAVGLARTCRQFDDSQRDDAPADVFFLHGTMEGFGNRASINRFEKEIWKGFNTHHQMTIVTAFTGTCRAYAPLYRQCAAMGSWDLAYEDCLAAFEHYLKEAARDRPLVLAGHSQGSMHLARLVKERVAPDAALLSRVVAVYAPGAATWIDPTPLPLEDGTAAGPAPAGPVVAMWATVAPEAVLQRTLVGHMAKGSLSLAANPGAWVTDGHLGALLQDEGGTAVLYQGLVASSEVKDGLLRLHPADGAEAILSKLNFGGQDYHAYDVHLFWGNIRKRVREQVEAHLRGPGSPSQGGA